MTDIPIETLKRPNWKPQTEPSRKQKVRRIGLREQGREEVLEGGVERIMSRQIDKKVTKQVRIDSGIHKLVKIKAARAGTTIRSLIEGALADILDISEG